MLILGGGGRFTERTYQVIGSRRDFAAKCFNMPRLQFVSAERTIVNFLDVMTHCKCSPEDRFALGDGGEAMLARHRCPDIHLQSRTEDYWMQVTAYET